MATDEGGDDAHERRALERLAYGPAATETEALEAQQALRNLNPPPAEETVVGDTVAEETAAGHELDQRADDAVESDARASTPSRHPRAPRRWAVGICVLVIVGALGFASGQFTGRAGSAPGTTWTESFATATPATIKEKQQSLEPTDPADDRVVISQTTVEEWFGVRQRSEDVLPAAWRSHAKSLDLSSSRLAAVDRQTGKLWVVREKAPNPGYCLIQVSHEAGDISQSDLACATLPQFLRDGLILTTWSGGLVNWNESALTIRTAL